jgi:hypothetical protein
VNRPHEYEAAQHRETTGGPKERTIVTVEVRKPIVEQYTDDQVRKAKACKKQRDTASLDDSAARRALELRSAKKSIAVIDSPNVVRGGATSRTREGNIFEANDHARMRSNEK